MAHEMRDDRIQSEACEVNVVHHCNLSCRSCTHLSPRAAKFFVDPDRVHDDLAILARYYHPKRVSLLGGEPLLHPDLLAVAQAVRESGISECIRVVTNGILLGRMPDRFWACVDQVHISLYPGYGIRARDLKAFRRRAREHRVKLELRYVDSFRETYAASGTTDARLIHRIYATCQAVWVWHCHTMCDGHLYKCSQSVFIPRYLHGKAGADAERDGLKVAHSATFRDDLARFLRDENPLSSCRYCLGAVGKRFPHVQDPHHTSRPPRSTEELVDWEHLERLETADSLGTSQWVRCVGTLAKKMLASMPSAVRLHPVVWRAIAAVRDSHPAFR